MRRAFWLVPLLLLPATLVFGANYWVGIGDDCSSADVCFYPTPLAIQVGDNVTFYVYNSNTFTGPHNVVADDGSFRCASGCDGEGGDGSPREFPQWSFTRSFNTPGIVAYHDEVSLARGVLVVQEPGTPAELQTAYEYIHGWPFDHVSVSSYFVTSNPDEIAMLFGGAFDGKWRGTLETFLVWRGSASGALPTCRFFDRDFGGHFFTPYAAECSAVQAQERWQYEGIAFYLQVPDESGNCPAGTTTLFRLYNQSIYPPPSYPDTHTGAPLHRYTTSVATFNRMRAAGWVAEGDYRTSAFACVPF
jgi:plastocyanin